ncbi:MAG: amino acid permease [Acidobacteria bacterium]|nr:amino acid permease [Acidobacteriota bacterium]
MENTPQPSSETPLVRALGLPAATSIVVGTIIGTGIFLVTSSMMQSVKTPGLLFLVWIVGGFLSLFGALGYSELGVMMPHAGGEYVYLRRAYGNLPAYLYGWTISTVAKPGSIAALGTGFALFLSVLLPVLNSTWHEFPFELWGAEAVVRIGGIQFTAVAVVLVLSFINVLGVKAGGSVQTSFTVLKAGAVVGLIVLGLSSGEGDWSHFAQSAGLLQGGIVSLFGVALIQALWAYDGWNNLAMVGGEIENPQRNIPLCLILGTALVGLLYLLTNLVYVYILPPAAIAGSSRIASDVAQVFLGPAGARFIAVAALVSTFASLNGAILTGARVPYALAHDGLLFRPLARVHPRWRSPHVALTVQGVLALLLVFSGTYGEIVTYVIFSEWVFYALVTAAIFRLRRREPDVPRPYRTWGYPWIPLAFIASSLFLLVNILFEQPVQSGFGVLMIFSGLLLYPLFRTS